MGNFTFQKTPISGVVVVDPMVFGDARGYFMETYQHEVFIRGGINASFVQDNQSMSRKGILRGMHIQKTRPQAKLVRVLQGEVFDVCVDVRKGSETYGHWYGLHLSEENKRQLYVPRGLLHGFMVTSDTAVFAYKCDDYYAPEDEGGMLWNDPDVGIRWPEGIEPVLSEKDKRLPKLRDWDGEARP